MVDMLLIALKADATLLETGMSTCMDALASGNEMKPVTRRLRHAANKLYELYGHSGRAAYAVWRTRNPAVPHRDICVQEWDTRAAAALEAWDAPPVEWLRVLRDPANGGSSTVIQDTIKGTEIWRPLGQPTHGPPVREMATWNNNSLFRRWRQGDLTQFLEDFHLDVLHVTEVRGSTAKEDSHVLRKVLAELGFKWVVWNWNTRSPSNHGSAVFSRHPMEAEFGVHGDGTDEEGRVITTHLQDGPSVIWVYSPCSTMGVTEPEEKRVDFDAGLKAHVLRVQAAKGRAKVLMAGDLNVAPLTTDSTVPMTDRPGYPSTKGYEIAAYRGLLQETGLTNAAEKLSPKPALTWRKKGYGHAMRLDHALGPATFIGLRDLQDYYVIDTLYVSPRMYRSDHHPVIFSVRKNEPQQGPMTPQDPTGVACTSKILTPRRLIRGAIAQVNKACRDGYKRSRAVAEDFEATCWLDATGQQEGEEYSEAPRNPGETSVDERGPTLTALTEGSATDDTFAQLAALAGGTGATAATCQAGGYRTICWLRAVAALSLVSSRCLTLVRPCTLPYPFRAVLRPPSMP